MLNQSCTILISFSFHVGYYSIILWDYMVNRIVLMFKMCPYFQGHVLLVYLDVLPVSINFGGSSNIAEQQFLSDCL